MAYIPTPPSSVLAKARGVWEEAIDKFGRPVDFYNADDSTVLEGIKAFCKRPKILGLFDRTEQSYDQERYMVMVKYSDMAGEDPTKFARVRWNDEDHVVISVTEVDLFGTLFGYRILVKG